jgi:chromosome partitioning protein
MPGREFVLSRLLGAAETPYDAVLIDVSPSINLVQTCAMLYAGNVLIPVGMDMLSLQGAVACCETGRLLTEAYAMEVRPLALLPAMVDRRFSLTAYILRALEEVSQRYGVPLLHAIRTDGTAPRAERARTFLVDYDGDCRAMRDYRDAAAQLAELPEVRSATAKPNGECCQEALSA